MVKTNQEEQRKAPILRFKGFTNDWEQRKLDKIVSIKSGWSPSKFIHLKKSDELFIKVDDLNYSDKIQTDSKLKVETNFNIEKIKKNSIIFPKRGVAIKTNKVRILGKESYIDTNIMALQTNEINYSFLYNLILKIGLYKIADTSTIPQINNKHINSYKIHFPKFDKEQQKIGNFIDVLDYLIALYERKANYYNCLFFNLKKMFFAKNKKTKSLIELIDIKTGYRNSEDNIEKGKYLFFDRSVEVKKLDEFDFDEEAIILPGEGKTFYPKYINDKYALHQRSYSLFNFKNIYPKYLYYFLTTQSNNFLKYSVGTTVPSLRKSTFKHINVPIKSMNTQIQYATILEKIEIIIDENLNKINSLKQIKKELLDTMFI